MKREVVRRFAEDLRRLRLLAGQPSYSILERLSRHSLKRATMSDVLNGNRVNLPDWRFVHEFLAACQAAAAENRLDVDELGTIADWKRHWDGADSGVIDAGFPGHASRSSGRIEHATEPQRKVPIPSGGADPPEDDSGSSTARPSVWGPVPSRLPDFVGREAWLERLRESLTRDDRVGVVAIQGLPGIGKTQLAIEYASRHADAYDLVWWIPCDDAETAHEAMTSLAALIGAARVGVVQEPDDRDYTELFDVLRRRQRFDRWLLIFDNADKPEDIKSLIPPLSGDVLITTRNSRWEASGELLELDVFDRAESVEFLRRRMRTFTDVAAHQLAEGAGDLPLLLEHAVESHVEVDTYLSRLESEPLALLNEQPADYHSTIASVWRTSVNRLRGGAPDAFDLLRCLASFGTDPVPREALERGSFLTDVSIHGMLRDPIRMAGAIGKLRRAGLVRMNPGTRSLAVHRITRCLVRGLIASPEDGERLLLDVHLLLAAADPRAPEDPTTWEKYEELRGHALVSQTAACQQELVREFVVNLVRYLTAAGDPHSAVALAGQALAGWDTGDGGLSIADCRVTMRLAIAEALFAQGKWQEAFQLRLEALAAIPPDPDQRVAEILALKGASGARFRVTGEFAEALAADRESVLTHVAEFGADDPRTFSAANSLIVDLALSGSGAEAAAEADRVYGSCLAFYGDARHPAVLAAYNALGRCQWLAGHYGEAVSIMGEVRRGYAELADGGILNADHPWRFIHEIDYAIARRDSDPASSDLRVLADDVEKVRRRCWRTLGADYPQTLGATVVLASILRRIDGRAGEAVRLLEDAERRYRSALPGHPYGKACGAFLAAVRGQAPNGSPQESVPIIQDLLTQLASSVGDAHQLSLGVRSALANALARAGNPHDAVKPGQEALVGFRELLGPDHPHTRIVAANVEAIQSGATRLTEIDFTPLPL